MLYVHYTNRLRSCRGGSGSGPSMHDDLRKVQISRRKTGHAVSPAQAVPPHVPTKGLARGEAQPTHGARVDLH